MDALKFFKECIRMCNYYYRMNDECNNCPREHKGCEISTQRDYDYIKEYIADVEKWSKEHPQRTRLQDFREKYPKAPIEADGTPAICCIDLGYRQYDCDPLKENCVDCWNMPVEEDDE